MSAGGAIYGGMKGSQAGGWKGAVAGAGVGVSTGAAVGATTTVVVFRCLLDGTNDLKRINNAITVGFRVKLEASNPWHTTIARLAEFLPQIIEKLMRKYKSHMFSSGKFHLNVDKNADDPVFMVISPMQEELIRPADSCPYLVQGSDTETLSIDDITMRARNNEIEYSAYQEGLYKDFYGGKDIKQNYIHECSWLINSSGNK